MAYLQSARQPRDIPDLSHRPVGPSRKNGAATTTTPKRPGARSELWQRLREARRFANLRQEDLAIACGVTRASVAMWESTNVSYRTRPDDDSVVAIARLCKVPLSFLTDDQFEPGDVWRMSSTAPLDGAANDSTEATPALSLLGMDDRRAKSFWSAVEFDACERKSSLLGCFAGRNGALPDFLHGDSAVVFASDLGDARAILIGALAVLLQAEKQQGRALDKHVLVFRAGGPARFHEGEAERQFATSVRVIDTVKEASKYLQSLN
jgi:transcriptional regulator with XRE-family HTH domain